MTENRQGASDRGQLRLYIGHCSHLIDLHDHRYGMRRTRVDVVREPARVGVHTHPVARRLHQFYLLAISKRQTQGANDGRGHPRASVSLGTLHTPMGLFLLIQHRLFLVIPRSNLVTAVTTARPPWSQPCWSLRHKRVCS